MNTNFKTRKAIRERKWGSLLIKPDGLEIVNEPLEPGVSSIKENLELLHQLRLMAYPELRGGYRMDKTIVKVIRPEK
jgi:hypothetical protein